MVHPLVRKGPQEYTMGEHRNDHLSSPAICFLAEQKGERLCGKVRSAIVTDGEDPKQGAQWKTWNKCVVDDLIVFEATEGPTGHPPLVLAVEIAVWTIPAKKAGKRYRGVPEPSLMHCSVTHPCRCFVPRASIALQWKIGTNTVC